MVTTTAQLAVGALCRICFLVPQVLPVSFRDPLFQNFGDNYHHPQQPQPLPLIAPPKVEPCNGFPGTYQWNNCWSNYNKNQAAQYPAQSQANNFGNPANYGGPGDYGNPVNYGGPGDYGNPANYGGPASYESPANYGGNAHFDSLSDSHGSSTFLNSNGYIIRASGLSLNANNFNGQLYIEASSGVPDRIDAAKQDNTLRLNLVYNGGRLTKWATITPPRGIRVDSLRYEQRDGMLRIWADEGRNNKGFLGFRNSSGVLSTMSLSCVIAVALLQVITTTSFLDY